MPTVRRWRFQFLHTFGEKDQMGEGRCAVVMRQWDEGQVANAHTRTHARTHTNSPTAQVQNRTQQHPSTLHHVDNTINAHDEYTANSTIPPWPAASNRSCVDAADRIVHPRRSQHRCVARQRHAWNSTACTEGRAAMSSRHQRGQLRQVSPTELSGSGTQLNVDSSLHTALPTKHAK